MRAVERPRLTKGGALRSPRPRASCDHGEAMRSTSVSLCCALLVACASAGVTRNDARAPDGGTGLDAAAGDAGAGNDSARADAWAPGIDAATGTDASGIDASSGIDAYSGIDAFIPVGAGAYIDRCIVATDCASGLCEADRGGTHFCSRSCATDLECAHEHVCAAVGSRRVCLPDDTGAPCSTGAPERCTLGLCLGTPGGGQCTRPCASAAECPAGFACTTAGGSATPICVDIERSCTAAADCATGNCIPGIGCTSVCRSPSDCPRRLAGLPAYACDTSLGTTQTLCIPPADILGDSPIGASCPAIGTNLCRSGACDDSAPLGPMCTQACTAQGGCAPGLGCFPIVDTGGVTLACSRAGARDLTQTCTTGRDCGSGLCDATGGFCTRLCLDGLCPTSYRCEPIAGFGIALCRR